MSEPEQLSFGLEVAEPAEAAPVPAARDEAGAAPDSTVEGAAGIESPFPPTGEQAAAKTEEENTAIRNLFMESLGVDEEVAEILVQEGFTNLEEVAYVPDQELLAIEEFDESIVEELRTRARDALLASAITGGEGPADDLFEVEGMTDELARALADQGVSTRDDLADLGSDELAELIGIEEDAAGEIIMAARAHWFAE